MNSRLLPFGLIALLAPLSRSAADGLDGSPSSMEEQHAIARESDYSFLRKPADVERLVELGRLVQVESEADYALSNVSFPFARPEVRTFIQSLAADYRDEFGFRLVVTSLTRPTTLQPANAHDLSVHPAGMAVDLRVPTDSTRKKWLESRLLKLEEAGAIDVTRERHPPHYHVAVFAGKYLPIAAVEDSVRTERRVNAELARIAAAVASRTESASPGLPTGLLVLGSLSALAFTAPMAIRRRRRFRARRMDTADG